MKEGHTGAEGASLMRWKRTNWHALFLRLAEATLGADGNAESQEVADLRYASQRREKKAPKNSKVTYSTKRCAADLSGYIVSRTCSAGHSAKICIEQPQMCRAGLIRDCETGIKISAAIFPGGPDLRLKPTPQMFFSNLNDNKKN